MDELKSKKAKSDLSENLNSFNVETTMTQEKEGIFTGKERREDKAKPILESLKQLNIQLVNTLETADKFSQDKLIDQKVDKKLISKTEYIQTTQIFSNNKESTFEIASVKEDQSTVDLIESQALCTSETQLNDKEQDLKKLKSKKEKLNFNYERKRNLNVQECMILQNDQRFDKDIKPKSNKADLQLQSNEALQSSEVLTNEKENKSDFKKKMQRKRLTPLILTKEAVIIKQVESKDLSVNFEEGKLELEQIAPVIDTLQPLEISKPNAIESLKKHKKTVTIAEQADFNFLENIGIEIGVVKSASTIEPFILEQKDLTTKSEFNLTDKKAIQEQKSLILEKEQQFESDKQLASNASKDLFIDNAVIVSLNEKIDTTTKFDQKKAKKSKASRDLSESRLKLVEIKDLQINGSVDNLKEQIKEEKASLNLNENLSIQVCGDRHLEKELELNLPKIKRKSIKDKKVLLKSRSLSVERSMILNKEETFDMPKIKLAKAQHQLISSSNLIEQEQQEILQSTQDFKSQPLKFKKASVSLSNLYSIQIDQTKYAESEQNLNLKSFETTKLLPINICGQLASADSQSILTDYNLKLLGKFLLSFFVKCD